MLMMMMMALLNKMKELLIQTQKCGGHTEQGLCLLLIFVIDISKFGLSCLQNTQASKKRRRKTDKKNILGLLRIFRGTAVSSTVSRCIRSKFAETPVFLLSEVDLIERIVKNKVIGKEVKFIGLDCEWVSDGMANDNDYRGWNARPFSQIALIQIATLSECFLIRLCCLENAFPKALKDLLENRHILKFGVGVEEDCKRLRMLGVKICGAVDLRFLIQRCHQKSEIIKFPDRINGLSLYSLADSIVGLQMDKSYRVRCSNWETRHLSKRQIAYAANDAIVALQIYLALCLEKVQSKRSIELSKCLQTEQQKPDGEDLLLISFLLDKSHAFCQGSSTIRSLNIWSNFTKKVFIDNEVAKVGYSLCQGIVDLAFKDKSSIFRNKSSSDTNLTRLKKQSEKSFPVRKSPLYHNCLLLAPDGCLLCTCDKKKAEWYVLKNLGTVVNKEPYTVQLNFDPSGRPFVDRDYYTSIKVNRCVVCGKEEDYVKKMIVPRDYRRHFPSHLKDHLSHDVLLLCVACHRTSGLHDMELKQRLSAEYSVPLRNGKSVEDSLLKKVKSAAKALLHAGEKIPEERKASLKGVLKGFLKKEDFEKDELLRLSEMGTLKDNELYEGSHGERIVAKIVERGGLKEFIILWREHFLQTMKPKFLPEMWSIDHNIGLTEEVSRS